MERIISFLFKVIIQITGGLFGVLIGVFEALLTRKPKTGFSASFMPSSRVASRLNHGFTITGTRAITRQLSYSNCMVLGSSGSGKSSCVGISSVFSLSRGGSSMCINDPSGEVYAATAAYLASKNYTLHRIDFTDPSSGCFNALAHCRSVSDMQKLAHVVNKNSLGESKGDVFWERSCEMLITLFGRYLLFHAAPEYRTMANILRLVECFATEPTKTDKLFVSANHEELLSAYKSFVAYGERTLSSVIATARASLSIFSDPLVARTTSFDSLDLSRLREDRVAVYIQCPITHAEYLRPVTALFFQSAFNMCMDSLPEKYENSVFFLLDEAGSMRFSALSTTIANCRKFRVGTLLLLQDYQSLIALYNANEAHNIRTNCHIQIFLKGQNLESCRELEAILGRYSYTDGTTERSRPLMTVDEIRTSGDAIILCGNHPPIKARMRPYDKVGRFRRYAAMPAYIPVENVWASVTPPLIPLV